MSDKIALRFSEDDLTIGDLEDFEEVAGVPLFEAIKPVVQRDEDGKPLRDDEGRPISDVELTARALKALVYVTLRREKPGFTVEDARNVKVTALEFADQEPAEGDSGNGEGQGEADGETV